MVNGETKDLRDLNAVTPEDILKVNFNSIPSRKWILTHKKVEIFSEANDSLEKELGVNYRASVVYSEDVEGVRKYYLKTNSKNDYPKCNVLDEHRYILFEGVERLTHDSSSSVWKKGTGKYYLTDDHGKTTLKVDGWSVHSIMEGVSEEKLWNMTVRVPDSNVSMKVTIRGSENHISTKMHNK